MSPVPHDTPDTSRKSGQGTTFVGGLARQKSGISVMDLLVNRTHAQKGWFWFDGVWVALGTNIRSEVSKQIVTGINQVRLRGPVLIDGKKLEFEEHKLNNVSWVWHDSIAYIFPNRQNLSISAKKQKGQLRKIYKLGKDTIYEIDVFSLWYDHGVKPSDESYAYIVKPGCDASDLQNWLKQDPIKIMANNNRIQAVTHQLLGITGMAFWEAGTLAVNDNLSFAVSVPCMLLFDHKTGGLAISDPTMTLKDVVISKITPDGPIQKKQITFPQPDMVRGASVVFSFEKP